MMQKEISRSFARVLDFVSADSAYGSRASLKCQPQPLPTLTANYPGRERTAQRLSVLVVDDDIASGLWLAKQVKAYGCHAETATNGREALRLLEGRRFDLVITDCRMLEISGFELSQLIQQRYAAEKITVIGVTANLLDDDLRRSALMGMHQCLLKPLSKGRLARLLNKVGGQGYPTAAKKEARRSPQSSKYPIAGLFHQVKKTERQDFLRAIWSTNLDDIKALSEAVISQDGCHLAHLAHKLRGVATLVGHLDVINSAAELESMCNYRVQPGNFPDTVSYAVSKLCTSLFVFNQDIAAQLRKEE